MAAKDGNYLFLQELHKLDDVVSFFFLPSTLHLLYFHTLSLYPIAHTTLKIGLLGK